MWRFANLYLVLFLLDSGVSLLDDVASQVLGMGTLHTLRGLFAFLPFVFSFPLYVLAGSMRGFPKHVILPMTIFQIWCGVFLALPLPIYLGMQNTNLLLSATQLFMSIAALVYLHQTTIKQTWLYTEPDFSRLIFGWKRMIGFIGANIIVVVPLLFLYLAVCLSLAASHLSRGFIHLDTDGIFVEARTYAYQDRNLYLLPTFHVAESRFYRALVASLPEANTAVLLEGVTDNQDLVQTDFTYRQLAQRFRLEAQDNRIFSLRHFSKRCDVDMSQFSPETRLLLNAAGRLMQRWLSGKYLTVLTQDMLSPRPDPRLLWQDLVEMRNHRLLKCIRQFMQEYDNLLIPWGAAHMPGLEKEILKWGATLKIRKRVRVMGW